MIKTILANIVIIDVMQNILHLVYAPTNVTYNRSSNFRVIQFRRGCFIAV